MTSTRKLTDQRARLRDRERDVLAELLTGRVPSGFDPASSAVTTIVLIAKRWAAARSLAPELAQLPRARDRFRGYATKHQTDCAHGDLAGFVSWLAAGADRSTAARLRLHAVHAGRRRFTVARVGGRRVLAVGLGATVWHLALVPPQATESGTQR